MVPSEISFTDNLSAVDRIYATHSQVAEPDSDGNVSVPHIDVDNEDMNGEPVDLANVGVPVGAESQAVEETDEDTEPAGTEVTTEEPETPVDPDEVTEAELEELTAPEEEQV